ncbi:hypothetical protein BDN70DRAFT_360518 [Pholiota conissans]|uniref:Uncharacterized protein n=1 Tax=Pholiota conissans TaxID=109636 RepID=A0A9P5Z9I4_9AGAR|nr:hypothetical protein BDN70DRAFT_360518 [Pholiota conissans]
MHRDCDGLVAVRFYIHRVHFLPSIIYLSFISSYSHSSQFLPSYPTARTFDAYFRTQCLTMYIPLPFSSIFFFSLRRRPSFILRHPLPSQ